MVKSTPYDLFAIAARRSELVKLADYWIQEQIALNKSVTEGELHRFLFDHSDAEDRVGLSVVLEELKAKLASASKNRSKKSEGEEGGNSRQNRDLDTYLSRIGIKNIGGKGKL